MSQTRRLAAILAADVAGYSRLIGADEGGTLQALKAIRAELVAPHGSVPTPSSQRGNLIDIAPSPESSSQRTPRWREMDSNFPFRAR